MLPDLEHHPSTENGRRWAVEIQLEGLALRKIKSPTYQELQITEVT
jgi:hypothetical protein